MVQDIESRKFWGTPTTRNERLPFLVGVAIALLLNRIYHWWGLLVIFSWIGASISIGALLLRRLPRERRQLGRKVALALILPVFMLFIPLANRENLQLEGIVLLLTAGYFSKGVIHYGVAKVFGPFIWGRGFCGWACWTAAVLDWLPIRRQGRIPPRLRHLRWLVLAISVFMPLGLVYLWKFDVRESYLGRQELQWMMASNAVYYLLAIPLGFLLKDRRAFCKILCPVSLVMKLQTRVSLRTIEPTENACINCGTCNKACPMDVDVMSSIKAGMKVRDSECVLCRDCTLVCPVGAI